MSDPDRSRIESWLQQLSVLSPVEADARLAALRVEDPGLAAAVQQAWAMQRSTQGFPAQGLPTEGLPTEGLPPEGLPTQAVEASTLGAPTIARILTRTARPPADLPMSVTAGQQIADFRLVEPIGQGGMGQVWRAVQSSLGRIVALKLVRPDRVSPRTLAYFGREARAGGRLSHPGVVAVHGHGEHEGVAWIAMEFVEGCWTLRDLIDELAVSEEGFTPDYYRDVAALVAQVADALQAAHAAGVIHRDIKPQNILVTRDQRPKVTDFGLARIADESALSHTGDVAGTCWYMSPEQVRAARAEIDHRTDVFSLGVVLFEMLTGRRPFEGDTTSQVTAKILMDSPPDLRSLRSRIPHELAVICGKCLEKDRAHRYPDMAALAEDLRRHLEDRPILARPPSRYRRAALWVRRHPTASAVASILSVAVLVVVVLLVENVAAKRAATKSANSARDRAEQAEAAVDFVQAIFGRLSGRTDDPAELRVRDLVEVAATVAPPAESSLAFMQTEELMASLLESLGEHEQAIDRYENVAAVMLAIEERFSRESGSHERNEGLLRSAHTVLAKAGGIAARYAFQSGDVGMLDRAEELVRQADALPLQFDEFDHSDNCQLRALIASLRGDDGRARDLLIESSPTLVRALASDQDARRRSAASSLVTAAAILLKYGDHAHATECLEPVLAGEVRSTLGTALEVTALTNRMITAAKATHREDVAHFAAELATLFDTKFAADKVQPIRSLPAVWDTLVNLGLPPPATKVQPMDRWRAVGPKVSLAERAKFLGSLGMASLVAGDAERALAAAAAMVELGEPQGPEHGPQFLIAIGAAFRCLESVGDYARIADLFFSAHASLAHCQGGDYEPLRPRSLLKGVAALAHQCRADDVERVIAAHSHVLAGITAADVAAVLDRVRAACERDAQRGALERLDARLAELRGR